MTDAQPSKEDEIAESILEMIASRGTVSIGDLLVVPDWAPDQVKQALGQLQSKSLVTQVGNYYSLSQQGAREKQKWGRTLA